MVTKRQLNALERKLNLSLDESRIFVFDEVEEVLFDRKGRELSRNRLKEIENTNSVIIIDDL